MENTQNAEVKEVKTAGFLKRNANLERIEQEEKELEEMKKANAEPAEEQQEEAEPSSAEEKTFKKRYGDLRRHAQKKEEELQVQIDQLRNQLEESTKKEIKYPKSEAELEQWMAKYPDVAKIVETIAMKKASEQASEFETRFREIDEMKTEALREKAEAELMRLHPDFDSIRDSEEFHEWVEEQPKWVQDALYDNHADAVSAARAIDLYKADKGIKTKRSASSKDAATSVGTRGSKTSVDSTGNGKSIRESEVQRMKPVEYERRQEEIAEAIRSGNFIYDLSGSAR
jgi:hypothetical protein